MLRLHRARHARARRSHVVESLESRTLLAAYNFIWVGGDGNWSDQSHWSSNAPSDPPRPLPTVEGAVTIPAGVTVSGGGECRTALINGNLRLPGAGALTIAGNAVTLNGTLTIGGGGPFPTQVRFNVPAIFNGTGTVTFDSGGGQIVAQSPGVSLTLGPDLTIRSNNSAAVISGTIVVSFATVIAEGTSGFGLVFDGTRFTNLGNMLVNGSTLRISSQGWANQGKIKPPTDVCVWANRWAKHKLHILVQHHPDLIYADEHGGDWAEIEASLPQLTAVDRCGNERPTMIIDLGWLCTNAGTPKPDLEIANAGDKAVVVVPPLRTFLDHTCDYFRKFIDLGAGGARPGAQV